MKRQMNKLLVMAGIVAAIAAVVAVLVFDGADPVAESSGEGKHIASGGKERPSPRKKSAKARKGKKTASGIKSLQKSKKVIRQGMAAMDDEEARLSPMQRKILQSIRDASDNEDKSALIRIVGELQSMEGWPDSVPDILRLEAIEALAWIGKSCLPEAVGFLADPNEEVAQSAASQFEDAVSDSDLSDKERSGYLLMASQVVSNPDTMESMMFELNNMRNSVAVDTIKQLWESGNATAINLLAETVESLTGEEGIDTPEKLDAWLAENPDDEDDDETYGGIKGANR